MTVPETDIRAVHTQARLLAEMAREEDLGSGDVTTALLDTRAVQEFRLVARQRGALCGREIGEVVLAAYGDSIDLAWSDAATDGALFEQGQSLAVLRGQCGDILAAERVFLNFLQRLCGIATSTRAYVDAVAGTDAKILDTRKTTPGWRVLEKYAVRCGGGHNHRMGLYDAVLVKDNHLAGIPADKLAGRAFEMLNAVSALDREPAFIEIEADTIEQVEALLSVVGIDIILLDNFSLEDLRRAVALRDDLNLRGKVALEASGGVTLKTVRSIAETAVDRISVGAITHSALALDLALDEGQAR